jgi:hypothetical protein
MQRQLALTQKQLLEATQFTLSPGLEQLLFKE